MNSASVGSNTVNNTHDNEHSGLDVSEKDECDKLSLIEIKNQLLLFVLPNKRTSFQPDRTLQISMQSKYLGKYSNQKVIVQSLVSTELTLKHLRMKSKTLLH